MAVVQVKSDLFRTQPLLGQATPDPARARGRLVAAQFTVSNLSPDSALSQYLLAELPADCILAPSTFFKVDGWGFATVNIGTKSDIDALISILKSAGTYVRPVVEGAAASHGKYLWELLGLAADPGGTIALYAQGPANATGAGTMTGEFHYYYR
jgi:hypothetical protein